MPNWTPRQWWIVGGVLAAVLVIIGVAVAAGGGGEQAESTTTTTESTTTTTAATTTTTTGPTYPLTGLPVDDPARASRPVLVVKIDNAEPRSGHGGRPQAGINQADVVYEEMVEGSVTRFAALFQSQDADPVGPVRSARTTDLLLMAPLNRPLFAWSGANAGVAGQVRAADLIDVGYDAASRAYQRVSYRRAPYNLFSATPALRAAAPDEDRPPPTLFDYRAPDAPVKAGRSVDVVHLAWGGGPGNAPVDFRWDGSGWARTQRGEDHLDADGRQIAPPNVLVRFTPYKEVQCCDAAGFPIVEAQLIGEGDAWVLTGGHLVEAHWSRPDRGSTTTYTTSDGKLVGLMPGQTWVAIVPPGRASAE